MIAGAVVLRYWYINFEIIIVNNIYVGQHLFKANYVADFKQRTKGATWRCDGDVPQPFSTDEKMDVVLQIRPLRHL